MMLKLRVGDPIRWFCEGEWRNGEIICAHEHLAGIRVQHPSKPLFFPVDLTEDDHLKLIAPPF